jgi:hypothetical protein
MVIDDLDAYTVTTSFSVGAKSRGDCDTKFCFSVKKNIFSTILPVFIPY